MAEVEGSKSPLSRCLLTTGHLLGTTPRAGTPKGMGGTLCELVGCEVGRKEIEVDRTGPSEGWRREVRGSHSGVAHWRQGHQRGQGKDLHMVGGSDGNLASISPASLGPKELWGPDPVLLSKAPSVVLSLNPTLPPRNLSLAALV